MIVCLLGLTACGAASSSDKNPSTAHTVETTSDPSSPPPVETSEEEAVITPAPSDHSSSESSDSSGKEPEPQALPEQASGPDSEEESKANSAQAPETPPAPSSDPGSDGDLITPDQAMEIILTRVPGASDADITEFELEFDDGRWIYEGEMEYQGLDYEFEIDAQNGNILAWEIDD